MRSTKLYAAAAFALSLAAGAALWAAASPAVAENDSAGTTAEAPPSLNQPLRALARPHNLRVGTAVDMDALAADATYEHLVGEQFNTVTAENVMKWQLVEPTRGQFNWGPADALVDYAQ